MNMDFNFLEKSVGKRLLFSASFRLENNTIFTDDFYAILRKVDVENDFIIVEQYFIESDDKFENEKIKSNKRKLLKGLFNINSTLNG